MDPNEALSRARRALERLQKSDKFPDEMSKAELQRYHEENEALANSFEALDGWLSKGGFLPKDWER